MYKSIKTYATILFYLRAFEGVSPNHGRPITEQYSM